MIKNSSKVMFMLILILGTLISISANSWLSAWMGLEINLLAFIPLMTASNNLISTEASLKYFLTQALASATLMFSIMFYMMKNNMLFQLNMLNYMLNLMIMSSLLLKMGAAPFHFWFPNVMEGLSWNNSLMLMTWQKIAPMMLLSYLNYNLMINMSITLSVIVGSLGGLNQTSLRKIMAFSSISHLGWMICALTSNESLWLMYFLIYFILSFNMILFFKMFNLSQMNQMFSSFFKSKMMKFILMMNMLSLGGLPPFLGFMSKLMVIQSMVINNQLMLMFMMTVLTLITLFFYLRLCYSSFMLNYNELYWNLNSMYKNISIMIFMITSCISIFSLFSISLLYYIL